MNHIGIDLILYLYSNIELFYKPTYVNLMVFHLITYIFCFKFQIPYLCNYNIRFSVIFLPFSSDFYYDFPIQWERLMFS